MYYGHIYYALTGERLIGGANVVTHGLSITRNHTRSLLRAFETGGGGGGGGGGGKGSRQANTGNNHERHPRWVWAVLGAMCPAAAPLGFSEYWNYVSHVIAHFPKEVAVETRAAPWVRYKVAHNCATEPDGDASEESWRTVAARISRDFPALSYLVAEDHSAARGVPAASRPKKHAIAKPKGA